MQSAAQRVFSVLDKKGAAMNTPTTEPSTIGVCDNLEQAEHVIEELRHAGFQSDEIGIIGHVGPDEMVPTPREMHEPEENAISGFLRGGLVGGIVGGLVIMVIPGIGAVAGQGWWFDVLGGAILGAVVCGLMVAFGTFAFSRPTTRYMAAELEKGRFIVTVKNAARKDEAIAVLHRQGVTEKSI
jgi:predicted lipid-binding transport protein (Tim44 family)